MALFAPDRQKFVILLKRGNLERNTIDYSLLLYRTQDALRAPRPDTLLIMSSSSNRAAIDNPKWLDDNRTIVFLGEHPGELPQVYCFDTETRRLTRRTSHSTSFVKYDISRNGHTLVYEAVSEKIPDVDDIRRNGVLIATQSHADLMSLVSTVPQPVEAVGRELYEQVEGRPSTKISTGLLLTESAPLTVSPDGRFALLAAHVTAIPDAWSQYADPFMRMMVQAAIHAHDGWSNVMQYMLLDTPLSMSGRGTAWIGGGQSVAISGTYLPLTGSDAPEREARKNNAYVAEVHLPGREIETVAKTDLKILSWNDQGEELLLGPQRDTSGAPTEAFRKTASAWQPISLDRAVSRPVDPVAITLDEDMNDPPRIYASATGRDQRKLLLDLNPQFGELSFGRVEAITWRASDEHEVKGGLYLPPDYRPGTRYPLVIQTHGFDPRRFWMDGPWSSAFAAQALAAQDVIVLQVGASVDHAADEKAADTPNEAPRQVSAYEGAIDELDRRGLIDRTQVGIMGFSRTAFYVEYALTHSRYHFAAASVADGFDGGYMNYMLWRYATDYELVNGGAPRGRTLDAWIKDSPGFNLDRVTTPLHMEYYGRDGFLGGWEWFSGLSLLDKPVEFLWVPDGYHMLIKPWDRLLSEQGTVDWFTFWLKGVKDPNPAKHKQYERWKELRSWQSGAAEKAPQEAVE